ncbi:MAG: ribonuclease R [Patescibacteria group bacterium]
MKKQKSKPTAKQIESVISINSKGVGFLAHPDFEKDIEVPREFLNTALPKDKVLATIKKEGGKAYGRVEKILERNKTKFVGIFESRNEYGFVDPDDRRVYVDFFIPEKEAQKAQSKDKVLVEIASWNDPGKNPEGRILEVLGKSGEHDVEIRSIVLERGIEIKFDDDIEKEAHDIKSSFDIKKEISKRKDFRQITTFTIDPEDAKDFDDAISFKKLQNGNYEVGIHIADVSHFVLEKTKLDKEAGDRSFSVYLVDRTIPMLPEILSNDLCSLNPDEDKLAFSSVFEITPGGKILSRWFGKTIINSNKRFSYEEAQEILDKKSGIFANELMTLNALAHKLRKEKFDKGAIAFESDEVKFKLDDAGKPIAIYKKIRGDTHKMVEDFMLLSNREVATFVYQKIKNKGKGFFLYRVHDLPNQEKLGELSLYLRALGYEFNLTDKPVSPKDINLLLQKIEGTDEEDLIRTATIRSMAKAIYSIKNTGHFGLAFKHYTHFTSPIRRYPDLLVHRLLHAFLENEDIPKDKIFFYERMAMFATEKEIDAASAERESIKYKQSEYMQAHIGEVYEGIISGVTDWGIYVEEITTKSEGMIRLGSLGDDFYVLNRKNYSIVGEKNKKKFSLGDKVKIKVAGANPKDKTIDYEFV